MGGEFAPDFFGSGDGPDVEPDFFGREKNPRWKRHEKDTAKRAKGYQVAGSGNQPGKPGDVADVEYLRECKETDAAGITIKASWLRKLMQEALDSGKKPLLEIRLSQAEAASNGLVPGDWVLQPAQDWEQEREGRLSE